MIVTLEPLEERHAATSWRWRNDPEVWTYTFNRPDRYITEEDERNWVRSFAGKTDQARFAILADGQYVGNIYLTNITADSSFYGIFIGEREWWGKGVGKKATERILQHAHEVLGLHHVFLRVKKENTAARRLYLALGFQDVSEEADHFLMRKDLP